MTTIEEAKALVGTEQNAERIVNACGYAYKLQEDISPRGDGTSGKSVAARERGQHGRTYRLGRLDKVLAMEQDELVKLIQKKFGGAQ